jgi:hypothetical protein
MNQPQKEECRMKVKICAGVLLKNILFEWCCLSSYKDHYLRMENKVSGEKILVIDINLHLNYI